MSTPGYENIYVKQFGSIVSLQAQQKGSRLRDTVTVKAGVVGEETFMDQIVPFTVSGRSAVLEATSPASVTYARRKLGMSDFYIAKAIDKMEEIRTLADPTSAITQSAIAGLGRKIDKLVIDALGGTAYTGKIGTTAVSLPTAQKIAEGSTGFTLTKWLAALEVLRGNEVDPSDEKVLVVSSYQLAEMLNINEIKSADYNTQRALVSGDVGTFLGCKVITSEQLPKESTARKCYLFTKTGVGLAIGRDVVSRIDELPTNHYAKQLYFSMSMAASRLEETKVVEIECKEV